MTSSTTMSSRIRRDYSLSLKSSCRGRRDRIGCLIFVQLFASTNAFRSHIHAEAPLTLTSAHRIRQTTALHVLTTPESIIEQASTTSLLDDLIDESIRTSARRPLIMQFDPSSGFIWKRWKGTVFSETWESCVSKMIYASIIFGVCTTYPGVKTWLSGFNVLWGQLLSVTTFTLTFFVNQSYALWRKCMELSRRLQGRLHDIDMSLAAHAARKPPVSPNEPSTYTAGAQQLLELVSRYVRLFNLLTYASFTRSHRPILTPKGMRRLVERGLMTSMERKILVDADIPATQRHNAVLLWIMRVFVEGRESGHFTGGAGFEDQWLEKIHVTRAQYGGIGDELQGRMPLAYVHIVQVLVDIILWMYPLMAFSSGMNGFLTVIGTGLLTMSYQGLFDLAKQFLDPYDNESYGKGEDPLVVDTLIAETNAGSVRWLNGLSQFPVTSQRIKDGELSDYLLPFRGYSVDDLAQMEVELQRKERELQEKWDREEEERLNAIEAERRERNAAEAMIPNLWPGKKRTLVPSLIDFSIVPVQVMVNGERSRKIVSPPLAPPLSLIVPLATAESTQRILDILPSLRSSKDVIKELIPDNTSPAETETVDFDDMKKVKYVREEDFMETNSLDTILFGGEELNGSYISGIYRDDEIDGNDKSSAVDEVGPNTKEVGSVLLNEDEQSRKELKFKRENAKRDESPSSTRGEEVSSDMKSHDQAQLDDEMLKLPGLSYGKISDVYKAPSDDSTEGKSTGVSRLFDGLDIDLINSDVTLPSKQSDEPSECSDSMADLQSEPVDSTMDESFNSSDDTVKEFRLSQILTFENTTKKEMLEIETESPSISSASSSSLTTASSTSSSSLPPMSLSEYERRVQAILDAEKEELLETAAILNAPPGAESVEVNEPEERPTLSLKNVTSIVTTGTAADVVVVASGSGNVIGIGEGIGNIIHNDSDYLQAVQEAEEELLETQAILNAPPAAESVDVPLKREVKSATSTMSTVVQPTLLDPPIGDADDLAILEMDDNSVGTIPVRLSKPPKVSTRRKNNKPVQSATQAADSSEIQSQAVSNESEAVVVEHQSSKGSETIEGLDFESRVVDEESDDNGTLQK